MLEIGSGKDCSSYAFVGLTVPVRSAALHSFALRGIPSSMPGGMNDDMFPS